jgi:hypothetical protein
MTTITKPKVYAREGRKDRQPSLLGLFAQMYVDTEHLRVAQQVRQTHLQLDGSAYYAHPVFSEAFQHLLSAQTAIDNYMMPLVKSHLCWQKFAIHIKGIGPHLLALVMGLIRDITPFTNVSKLWWLCGLAVVDGQSLRRVKGQVTNYDQRLKSILLGRVGGQLLRNADPFTAALYAEYYKQEVVKAKQDGLKPEWRPISAKKAEKGHAFLEYTQRNKRWGYYSYPRVHKRAIRKVVKLFIACLWEIWRKAEGLPVTDPYPMTILGHTGYITAQTWIDYNKNHQHEEKVTWQK